MANTLSPWIEDYMIEAAEQYGARIFDMPKYLKKKKVQIIEFLTYGSENQDTDVWACVSDKAHIVFVKFTGSAVKGCYASLKRRLTEHRGAIVHILNFQLMYSRVPGGHPMSDPNKSHICLECEEVAILGSSGESTFGNPEFIYVHPDISLWSEGLAKGGGGGNVLKDRKIERQPGLPNIPRSKLLPPMPSLGTPPPPPPELVQVALKRINVMDENSYKARWQFLQGKPYYRAPPSITAERSGSPKERSRSATPFSDWDPTQEEHLASSLPAPTPAQRPRPVLRNDGTPNAENHRAAHEVARKIPRPVPPSAPEQTGRVLVANSDTSGTQPSQPMGGVLLGGMVQEGDMPWMLVRDIGTIMAETASLRLHK